MKRLFVRTALPLALLLLLLLAACSGTVAPPAPTLPKGLEAGWNRFAPAADTICADGSEYAYFVSPGTVNKLIIDFEGGGACWNGGTCSNPSNPKNNFAGLYLDGVYGSPEDYGVKGIYERENPANPFRDWYHVHVSYCTADLHVGDNAASYSVTEEQNLEVQHKGAVNARAALAWVYENFSAPETVFVTGVSAGAYASIIWLPEIADHYPEARVVQLGDSGAGVVTADFFDTQAASWKLSGALPDLSEPVTLDQNIIVDLYNGVGKDHSSVVLSEYNSLFDGTQIAFYGLMHGITQPTRELGLDWSGKMTASLEAIGSATPTFRPYVSTLTLDGNLANGTAHGILQRPEFYTLETSGVKIVDWVNNLANGREVSPVRPEEIPN